MGGGGGGDPDALQNFAHLFMLLSNWVSSPPSGCPTSYTTIYIDPQKLYLMDPAHALHNSCRFVYTIGSYSGGFNTPESYHYLFVVLHVLQYFMLVASLTEPR